MRTAAHAATIPGRTAMRDHAGLDLGALFASPYSAFVTLRLWQARTAYRKSLMSFDGHRLADIGLSEAEAAREIRKPFWVA